ncbi:MAG: hypothetical protein LBL61_03970 [Elusimicrobiota bacterium]|jgi:hypothetical protein|nr:hypothetical protein [Elusimicrobiota bacterium]
MQKKGGIREIFKDNVVRIAVVILVIFIALPLFFRDMSKDADGAPVRQGGITAALPRTGIIGAAKNAAKNIVDRLARAYGFKGPRVIHVEDRITIQKLDPGVDYVKLIAQEAARERAAIEERQAAHAQAERESTPDFITLNGKGPYAVTTDAKGRKVVLLPDGPVLYENFTKNNISADEVNEARKYAPKKLKERQLIEAVQYVRDNNFPGGVAEFFQSGEYDRQFAAPARKSGRGSSGNISQGKSGRGGSKGAFGLGGGIDVAAEGGNSGAHSTRQGARGGPDRYYGSHALGNHLRDQMPGYVAKAKAARTEEAKAEAASVAELKGLITSPLIGAYIEAKTNLYTDSMSGVQSLSVVSDSNSIVTMGNENMAKMTEALLCGGNACNKKFEVERPETGETIYNPWNIQTGVFSKGEGPAGTFLKNNKETFEKFTSEYLDDNRWTDVDKKYNDEYRKPILNDLKNEGPVEIAVIDSIDEPNIKSVSEDIYYYQTVNYLFKDPDGKNYAGNFAKNGSLNGLLNLEPEKRGNVIVFAPSREAEQWFIDKGFTNVVFIDGVVTPENLDGLGLRTAAIVRKMIENRRRERAARQLAAKK